MIIIIIIIILHLMFFFRHPIYLCTLYGSARGASHDVGIYLNLK